MIAYKQQVLNDFNNRSHYENDFHRRAADRLVAVAKIQPGQNILDIATGNGLAAIAAAQLVGITGSVLGNDFTANMLQLVDILSSGIFCRYPQSLHRPRLLE